MIWKDIRGYKGIYQVSSCGKVRVLPRKRKSRHGIVLYKGRILKGAVNKQGYLHLSLYKKGNQKSFYVHVLVATYFVEGKAPGLEVNHKDGNKLNNNDWNLEWGTHSYNQIHASNFGLMKSGPSHPNSKLNLVQASLIIKNHFGKTNYNEVAKENNIPRNVAYRIMNGLSYRHLHKIQNTNQQ